MRKQHSSQSAAVDERLSRRLFLTAAAGMLGVASLPLEWAQVAHAAHDAAAARQGDAVAFAFLASDEAADVEAIAAQIIPTDQTPGAREAGVVYFIDRALGTLFPQLAGEFRSQLAEFRSFCRERNPAANVLRRAFVRAADRVAAGGRAHAVLRQDATADRVGNVLDARLRRQSAEPGLAAARFRRPACLHTALWLLRP